MKFSIITAVYNNASSIEQAILSVLHQKNVSIEYILIDGGSTDGTVEIIKKYNSQISYFISEKDKGIYDALNKGLQQATGDVIGFLHSDDLFSHDNILNNISEKFTKIETDGVYGDLQYVDKIDINKVIRFWKSKPFNRSNLKYGWMPAHPTLFLKKEVYKKHGLFDTKYKISADYEFMIRILSDTTYKFDYLPQVITKMRVGGESNKSIKNIILKSKEDLKAIKKNKIGNLFTLVSKNLRKLSQFF
ncbi:MAG: glycosyltransferase [Bacteroidales bacterium]|nr:glycosyltransferase [Bacteroidales bacterium]